MKTVPLSEAKDFLSALVEEANTTHEVVQITRHGRPAAVLMSVDELASMQETIYWLSRPGALNDLAQADLEIAARTTTSGDELGREFGVTG